MRNREIVVALFTSKMYCSLIRQLRTLISPSLEESSAQRDDYPIQKCVSCLYADLDNARPTLNYEPQSKILSPATPPLPLLGRRGRKRGRKGGRKSISPRLVCAMPLPTLTIKVTSTNQSLTSTKKKTTARSDPRSLNIMGIKWNPTGQNNIRSLPRWSTRNGTPETL